MLSEDFSATPDLAEAFEGLFTLNSFLDFIGLTSLFFTSFVDFEFWSSFSLVILEDEDLRGIFTIKDSLSTDSFLIFPVECLVTIVLDLAFLDGWLSTDGIDGSNGIFLTILLDGLEEDLSSTLLLLSLKNSVTDSCLDFLDVLELCKVVSLSSASRPLSFNELLRFKESFFFGVTDDGVSLRLSERVIGDLLGVFLAVGVAFLAEGCLASLSISNGSR